MLRKLSNGQVYLLFAVLLAAAVVASACIGAFTYSPQRVLVLTGQALGWLPAHAADTLDRNVFFQLRLPRVVLAGITGAVLGVSGTLMQGLFRNPIVEPGLVGTSSGAALGASQGFVFGTTA
jgi:iron complex transport system permease protein